MIVSVYSKYPTIQILKLQANNKKEGSKTIENIIFMVRMAKFEAGLESCFVYLYEITKWKKTWLFKRRDFEQTQLFP